LHDQAGAIRTLNDLAGPNGLFLVLQEILAAFARKHSIEFPLLSDKGSHVIRKFGIFNFNMAPDLRSHGVPHPWNIS
jgi:hypothetical protein